MSSLDSLFLPVIECVLFVVSGEEHYNCISALHKSMRGSDQSASLYWLARMLEGGEDPLYVARRLVRFASEDIGKCDERAQNWCPRRVAWRWGGNAAAFWPKNFLVPCGKGKEKIRRLQNALSGLFPGIVCVFFTVCS